ncbi:hypothetical protein Tco_1351767 [Tanacetum coccineum]
MAVAAMKHMALKFAKLDKFEGVDFRRWQKKMHLLLSSMSVVYLLTTHIPKDGENATVDQIRRRNKKKLWDSLEAKYMDEDASSKKFLVSNFTNYKMTGSRPVMEQYNELLGIIGRFIQHKMNMDEAIQVSYIIDKLPPSWKDFKHTLKHNKEELTLVELGNHLCIEESFMAQDSDKQRATMLFVHSNWTWLNIVNDNIGSAFMSTSKLNDSILWHARLGYIIREVFLKLLLDSFGKLSIRSEFGISSWRGSRVDGRSYLQSGAIDGSEANGIIRDPKQEVWNDCRSYKVRVGSNGDLLWEASVLYDGKKGGVRVAREDDRGVTEGREDVREVFQQRRSGAKRKLSRCGRNQLGNEPILALPEGADDFVVYYDARSKDLEACLEKRRR